MTRQQQIKHAFNRAHDLYDQHCALQEQVGHTLLALIKQQCDQADSIIDLGCGTGLITEKLTQLYAYQQFHAVDIASGLLAKARTRLPVNIIFHETDFNTLPKHDFDLVFSNMALHWSDDIDATLRSIQPLLKPQATLAFSLPIAGTLAELNNHYAINAFPEVEHITQALTTVGCEVKAFQYEEITRSFPSTLAALKSIKQVGASHASRTHKHLLGKSFLLQQDIRQLTYLIGYFIAEKT
jgi:malonyl-CoA O-methyltransferase